MKRTLFVIILSLVSIFTALLTGCNSLVVAKDAGQVVTKEFDLAGFDAVDVSGAFVVEITRSDSYSVNVTSRESAFKHIRVSTAGRTLRVAVDGLFVSFGGTDRPLEAAITMPELVNLKISGASRATVKGFESEKDLVTEVSGASSLDLESKTGDFVCRTSGASRVTAAVKSTSVDIRQSGASSMVLDVETGSFVYGSSGSSDARGVLRAQSTSISIDGASDLQLTGSGGNLKMTESGSSGANLQGFSVRDADLHMSGASDADVDIEGKLDLTLNGSSSLKYGGNPVFGERMEVTGGSKIEHR
jgi:hypothetical protein